MIKRVMILLGVLTLPLIVGLLFTYDVIKIEWVSMMEIQPSYFAQEDPLPVPPRSIPIQGAAYISELGAPSNPTKADDASLARGKDLYTNQCALCHGVNGGGNGPLSAFLTKVKPANLLAGKALTSNDGYIFMVITNGVEGGMPSLRGNLPEAQMRWDVVNYIRQLQKAKPQ
ncbi:MAG: cytochrome c [Anaerolineaceae bacterium]|nr:cytochrome c [Anaerolineaceae bacterium]